MTLQQKDAVDEATRLFAAFTRNVSAETLREFARVLMDAKCEACALEAIADMRDNGSKPPASTRALRESIHDRIAGVSHYPHLSETTRESAAGKAEGFWHGEAVRTVKSELKCDRLHAEHIAARIWFLGVCEPDIDALRVEVGHEVWRWNATWDLTEELVEHNWDMARRNAVRPVTEWPTPEWEAASNQKEPRQQSLTG